MIANFSSTALINEVPITKTLIKFNFRNEIGSCLKWNSMSDFMKSVINSILIHFIQNYYIVIIQLVIYTIV